jgi:MYXO-CTERM domain-containing protein
VTPPPSGRGGGADFEAAGGTALTWGNDFQNGLQRQLSLPVTAGVPHVVAVSSSSDRPSADGGTVTELRLTAGIGQSCGVGRGPLSTGFSAGVGALGVLALVARRRRHDGRTR